LKRRNKYKGPASFTIENPLCDYANHRDGSYEKPTGTTDGNADADVHADPDNTPKSGVRAHRCPVRDRTGCVLWGQSSEADRRARSARSHGGYGYPAVRRRRWNGRRTAAIRDLHDCQARGTSTDIVHAIRSWMREPIFQVQHRVSGAVASGEARSF